MLRPWKEEDAGDLACFADNPRIAANLRNAFPSPYSREDAVAYICACLEGDEDQQLTWAIQADGRAVGSIGVFRGEDVYEKNGEVGYWLAEPYWGRGIMTAAVRLAVDEGVCPPGSLPPVCRAVCPQYRLPPGVGEGGLHFGRNPAGQRVQAGEVLDSCLYALLLQRLGQNLNKCLTCGDKCCILGIPSADRSRYANRPRNLA